MISRPHQPWSVASFACSGWCGPLLVAPALFAPLRTASAAYSGGTSPVPAVRRSSVVPVVALATVGWTALVWSLLPSSGASHAVEITTLPGAVAPLTRRPVALSPSLLLLPKLPLPLPPLVGVVVDVSLGLVRGYLAKSLRSIHLRPSCRIARSLRLIPLRPSCMAVLLLPLPLPLPMPLLLRCCGRAFPSCFTF